MHLEAKMVLDMQFKQNRAYMALLCIILIGIGCGSENDNVLNDEEVLTNLRE